MIAKHVPMKSVKKSDFAELASYISDEQDKEERVVHTSVTNCHSDDIKGAIIEVTNVQRMNTRAESDKTYHLIVSFRAGERPSDDVLKQVETEICEGLGFSEHQRVSAVHHDTDNLHIHIAINKIHPTKLTIHTPYYDHKVLGTLCETLERKYGLEADNHVARRVGSEIRATDMEHHAGVESLLGWIKRECSDQLRTASTWKDLTQVLADHGLGLVARGNGFVITTADGFAVKASSVARDLSRGQLEDRLGPFDASVMPGPPTQHGSNADTHQPDRPTDAAGLLGWIKRECADQLRMASTWKDLTQVLADHGLGLVARGNGFVITTADGLAVKTSSIARDLSKEQLEKRLGAFDASLVQSAQSRSYAPLPIRTKLDTTLLFAHYQNEQRQHREKRSNELKLLRQKRDRQYADVKAKGKLKRAAVKLANCQRDEKRFAHSVITNATRKEFEGIRESYNRERDRIVTKYQTLQWADWLRKKAISGDADALAALRARDNASRLRRNIINGSGDPTVSVASSPIQDHVTKHGTIIYRAGNTAVRDDGKKLAISRGSSADGLVAALQLAMSRYGSRITVNGNDEFKTQIVQAAVAANLNITFSNPDLEQKRQSLLSTTTEYSDDRQRTRQSSTGRCVSVSGSAAGSGGHKLPFRQSGQRNRGNTGGYGRATVTIKPDASRVGTRPPPAALNRLRNLSDVPMVRIDSGSEVLLPGDVRHHVEQQGATAVHALRRPVSRDGLAASSVDAALKYVNERNKKKALILDISKHRLYNGDVGMAVFAGIRSVEGHSMALLQRDGEIIVMPITNTVADRLKRLSVGTEVAITKDGMIKKRSGKRR